MTNGGSTPTSVHRGGRPPESHVRFAIALVLVALGAAIFAVTFRTSLGLVYRDVFRASNVVEAIRHLPWWGRLLIPAFGGTASGAIARLRAVPPQGVSNVMEAVALGNIRLSLRATALRVLSSGHQSPGLQHRVVGEIFELGPALRAIVRDEARRGLDPSRRVVMRRVCA